MLTQLSTIREAHISEEHSAYCAWTIHLILLHLLFPHCLGTSLCNYPIPSWIINVIYFQHPFRQCIQITILCASLNPQRTLSNSGLYFMSNEDAINTKFEYKMLNSISLFLLNLVYPLSPDFLLTQCPSCSLINLLLSILPNIPYIYDKQWPHVPYSKWSPWLYCWWNSV